MSSEKNNLEQQSKTINNSLCSQSCTLIPVSSKPGTIKIKLPASVEDCNCTRLQTLELPKLCELTYNLKPATCPIPDSVTSSVEICNCQEEGKDMTPPVPTCESEEEGTHEHKYCSTRCCRHSSQGIQHTEPCSGCYTEACSSPLAPKLQKPHIEPRLKDHVPQSVEELKASLSGLTGLEKKLPPGNLLGCEYIDYRCQISTSLPCSPKDSQVSFACVPPRFGFSLNIEPNDHRFCTNPNECKHSKEFCPPESPSPPPSPPLCERCGLPPPPPPPQPAPRPATKPVCPPPPPKSPKSDSPPSPCPCAHLDQN